jgi:hypothetical protein
MVVDETYLMVCSCYFLARFFRARPHLLFSLNMSSFETVNILQTALSNRSASVLPGTFGAGAGFIEPPFISSAFVSVSIDPVAGVLSPAETGAPSPSWTSDIHAIRHSYSAAKNFAVTWSRRFIGLKFFLALAHHGESGYIEMIEHQVRMGDA